MEARNAPLDHFNDSEIPACLGPTPRGSRLPFRGRMSSMRKIRKTRGPQYLRFPLRSRSGLPPIYFQGSFPVDERRAVFGEGNSETILVDRLTDFKTKLKTKRRRSHHRPSTSPAFASASPLTCAAETPSLAAPRFPPLPRPSPKLKFLPRAGYA